MNPALRRLCSLAQQPTRRIIGLMSGTSLDGLDVALCQITGSGLATRVHVEQFATVPYEETTKQHIRRVFAQPQIDFADLCLLHPWLANLHAELVLGCLREWGVSPVAIDCLASHGQTVYHAPRHQHGRADFPNATLQIGDGDHLAVRTGIVTVSDFRQKHVAAGGEGAPLAVYGDFLLFSQAGEDRLLLNIGGIANFTYLPGSCDPAALFSTDAGPGNTLLDACTRTLFPGQAYDADGALAAQGQVHESLLRTLLDHAFFRAPLPKTTGPELFNAAYVAQAQQRSQTPHLPPHDLLATLTQFSAASIAHTITQTANSSSSPPTVYASGGGIHNPVLMAALQRHLPAHTFRTTDTLGIIPDAKEAVLFAVLANECLAGDATVFGPGRPGLPAVSMGKLSLPG